MRDVIKGKKLAAARPMEELAKNQRGVLSQVFQLNRRVFKAYLLKRKSGATLGLPHMRRHDQLPEEVDGSTAMAALALLSETRRGTTQNTSMGF